MKEGNWKVLKGMINLIRKISFKEEILKNAEKGYKI